MLIKYIGHACFKIRDSETGCSVVIDPYAPGSVRGFGDIVDAATEVICSHDHFDHNSRDSVRIEPRDDSPFEITCIDCWHDDAKGAKRGSNKITIVRDSKTGEKLIHYGDLGEDIDEFLTDEMLEILKDADVALVPIGGFYTIDADQALELIRRTSPRIAVPMHFRSRDAGFGLENIGSIEEFLEKAGAEAGDTGRKVKVNQMYFYDTAEYPMDNCIMAMRPQNISINVNNG